MFDCFRERLVDDCEIQAAGAGGAAGGAAAAREPPGRPGTRRREERKKKGGGKKKEERGWLTSGSHSHVASRQRNRSPKQLDG